MIILAWLFWTLVVLLVFALGLAFQMRMFAAMAMRLAVVDAVDGLEPGQAQLAVNCAAAADPERSGEAVVAAGARHLMETCERALWQLRTARRATMWLPIALVILAAAWRIFGGEV